MTEKLPDVLRKIANFLHFIGKYQLCNEILALCIFLDVNQIDKATDLQKLNKESPKEPSCENRQSLYRPPNWEERGQKLMEYIIEAGLVYGGMDEPVVMVWSANAAEQIGNKMKELDE